LQSSEFSAILSSVSERKNNMKNTMTETYGANYASFIRRTLKITKHPFIPCQEPVDETFVPRKKSEIKDGKGLDFASKV
jgi:hypothetical protein